MVKNVYVVLFYYLRENPNILGIFSKFDKAVEELFKIAEENDIKLFSHENDNFEETWLYKLPGCGEGQIKKMRIDE